MEAQLAKWRARLDELTAQAENASHHNSFDHLQSIDDLKAKCAIMQSRLDKLKTEG